jgi:hypothetical protein
VKDNVIRAFAVALKDARSTGAKLIHLIVPAKSSFSGTVVSEVVGDAATTRLLKGEAVSIKDGISIKLESANTVKNSTLVSVALARLSQLVGVTVCKPLQISATIREVCTKLSPATVGLSA